MPAAAQGLSVAAQAHLLQLNPGLRPYSAGGVRSTEIYALTKSKGASRAGTPSAWPGPESPAIEQHNRMVLEAHPPSMPRRHSPPGKISDDLEAQLDMTARALTAARNQVDEEKRKTLTARKSEDTQRARAAEARADAEKAWQTAWQSAEEQRRKREEQLASRLSVDRKKLDSRLQNEAAVRDRELERRVVVEVEARETQLPRLETEVDRRARRVHRGGG